MESFRAATKIWYTVVALLALVVAPVALQGVTELSSGAAGWSLLILAAGVWFGLHRTVRLSKGELHSVYTLDDAPTFAIIFLFSTPIATLTVFTMRSLYEVARLAKGLKQHRDRVTAARVVYHFSDIVFVSFATLVAGSVLDLFSRPSPLTGFSGASAALVAGVAWFAILFLVNAIHLAVFNEEPEAWLRNAIQSVRENSATAALFLPIGLLMSVFLPTRPWLVPLLFVPVILIHAVMEASDKLEVETEQTILALSTYLEERDEYTSGHSRRVAGYATAIARELGMSDQDLETTHRAGLIHDLGKIDVPDSVLRKPGFLNESERAVMRTHTDRAVELGNKLVALRKGLPFHLAAYHHENYDGTGYYGMAGKDIPLVSRMLAVADTFDAMTSDRPYRKGMNDSEAILRLKKAAGTQLDPRLVTAFLRAYDNGDVHQVRFDCPGTATQLAS